MKAKIVSVLFVWVMPSFCMEKAVYPIAQAKFREINVDALDRYGKTRLIHAALNNNVEEIKQLLQVPGIQVNVRDLRLIRALMYAAEKNNVAVLKELLKALIQVMQDHDREGNNILHFAVTGNQPTLAKTLVDRYKFLLTEKNKDGQAPLDDLYGLWGDQDKFLCQTYASPITCMLTLVAVY